MELGKKAHWLDGPASPVESAIQLVILKNRRRDRCPETVALATAAAVGGACAFVAPSAKTVSATPALRGQVRSTQAGRICGKQGPGILKVFHYVVSRCLKHYQVLCSCEATCVVLSSL